MPKSRRSPAATGRSATAGQSAGLAVLSRIAESMFWIGRYVERAEDTARLLQTHLRMLTEDTQPAEVDACRNLLALMNVDHVEEPMLTDLLRVLGYDPSEPTSIYFAYAAARDNARRAREVIPLDLWECVNTTWHQLPTTPFGHDGRPCVPELGARA